MGGLGRLNNSLDNEARGGRRFEADAVGRLQAARRLRQFVRVVVVEGGNRFAGFDGVAEFFPQLQADGVVNKVVLFVSAAAQKEAGQADLFTVNAVDKAVGGGGEGGLDLAAGKREG